MIYREYKINRKNYHLSKEDESLIRILQSVVKDISIVYQFQCKEGFYPKGLIREKLVQAAKSNPELLSSFTYINMKNGQLKAVPYHVHYAKYLAPIAKKIEKAVSLCSNKSFKLYLQAQAKSLLDGNYKEAFRLWLDVKNSKIDFSLGPSQRYLDKDLFIKRTFQAHVGVIDEKYTQLAEQYKEALYSSAKVSFTKHHSTDIPKRGVRVFAQATPALAGYPADVLASGEHFPSNLDAAREYGAKIIIYGSQLAMKFEKIYYPIFKLIFEPTFASKYSKEMLLEAAGWCIFLYEVGEQLHKFDGAGDRLKEFYAPIEKANGFASGIAHSKELVVKGFLSQEQLEAVIIIHIVWMLADWLLYHKSGIKQKHIIGNSILLNSYLSHGALREAAGISWPNFSRIFFEIESVAYQLVYLLQKGTYKEARLFIKKNADFGSFKRLSKGLSKINTQV